MVVPMLGLLALGEYAVLLGPPPRLRLLLLAMSGEVKVHRLRGGLEWKRRLTRHAAACGLSGG